MDTFRGPFPWHVQTKLLAALINGNLGFQCHLGVSIGLINCRKVKTSNKMTPLTRLCAFACSDRIRLEHKHKLVTQPRLSVLHSQNQNVLMSLMMSLMMMMMMMMVIMIMIMMVMMMMTTTTTTTAMILHYLYIKFH